MGDVYKVASSSLLMFFAQKGNWIRKQRGAYVELVWDFQPLEIISEPSSTYTVPPLDSAIVFLLVHHVATVSEDVMNLELYRMLPRILYNRYNLDEGIFGNYSQWIREPLFFSFVLFSFLFCV